MLANLDNPNGMLKKDLLKKSETKEVPLRKLVMMEILLEKGVNERINTQDNNLDNNNLSSNNDSSENKNNTSSHIDAPVSKGSGNETEFEKIGSVADCVGNEPLYAGEKAVGFTTSGAWGFNVNKSVAMGYVPEEYSKEGTQLSVDLLGARYPVIIKGEGKAFMDPWAVRQKKLKQQGGNQQTGSSGSASAKLQAAS